MSTSETKCCEFWKLSFFTGPVGFTRACIWSAGAIETSMRLFIADQSIACSSSLSMRFHFSLNSSASSPSLIPNVLSHKLRYLLVISAVFTCNNFATSIILVNCSVHMSVNTDITNRRDIDTVRPWSSNTTGRGTVSVCNWTVVARRLHYIRPSSTAR